MEWVVSTKSDGSLGEHFVNLEDPRRDQGKRHKLLDIIAMTVCAVIGGAEGWCDVELFGKCKYEWFKGFLDLPNGIPSPDTFGRVFARIDPEQFQACFMDWVRSVSRLTQGQVIALDGKTLRRSHNRNSGKAAIHLVSAWARENSLVLGQTKVDAKSNEITAIPELLNLLDVSGCIVTIDAMGCQKKIAQRIVSREADYVLAVKENQGRLLEDVKGLFSCGQRIGFEGMPHDFYQTLNKGHGRIETRRCWTLDDPEQLSYVETGREWPGLRSIGMVTAERREGGRVSVESRYYISSLGSDAGRLLQATRSHWGIENSLHWVLDLSFREDESRVRTGKAPENLALIRHLALNLLRQDRASKTSIKARRKQAGWDNDYLLTILSN